MESPANEQSAGPSSLVRLINPSAVTCYQHHQLSASLNFHRGHSVMGGPAERSKCDKISKCTSSCAKRPKIMSCLKFFLLSQPNFGLSGWSRLNSVSHVTRGAELNMGLQYSHGWIMLCIDQTSFQPRLSWPRLVTEAEH